MSPRPGLFLDRDGTINVEVDYLSDPAQLELIPGCAAAIERARQAGFAVAVITNQSGIARGKLTETDLTLIHARLEELLAEAGTAVDGFFFCPHHPTLGPPAYQKDCACRKPQPGMYFEAAEALDIDLLRSAAVGDSLRDLEAARKAGVPARYLVATGKGTGQSSGLDAADHFVADLAEAVEDLLAAR
jgi:D-glycero-D-manno-heptose 1,7-bisphosphate phosphatase